MKKSSAIFVSAIALGLAMVVPLKASAQGVTIYVGPQGYGAGYPAYAPYPPYGYSYPSYGYAYPSYGYGRPGYGTLRLRLRLRPSGLRHLLGPKSTSCSPS